MFSPDDTTHDLKEAVALLQRRYERERRARQQAEAVLEANSLDLYQKNQELLRLNAGLEDRVVKRTADLASAVARAEQASAAKGEFLARMSHEIRTPMNGVIGMVEALLNTSPTAEQSELLRTAYASADVLLHLINDILDYSKIEAGKLDIECIPFDLKALLAHIQQVWSFRASDKGLALESAIAADVPTWLKGDPTRLGQVLTNLVSNAIKFTSRGGVLLDVELIEVSAADATLRFTVTDSGVGISRETQDRLFTPFMQADGSTSRRFGGTGLGLAICQQLVALMGGRRIDVESAPKKGSKFSFALQLPLAAPQERPLPADASTQSLPLNCGPVLIVDDNETNRRVAQLILERLGVEHDTAVDGLDALERVQRGSYALVLMDCHMPAFDGFEATAAIRRWEREAERPHLPIVAVSASAFAEDRQRCAAAGMDDFVAKPINAATITATLSRWLQPVGDVARTKSPETADRGATADDSENQFDMSQLAEMRDIAGPSFVEFIDQFSTNLDDALPVLERAIREQDAPTLRKVAHKLKGTAATIGARRVAHCAFVLEGFGRTATFADADSALNDLHAAAKSAYAVLRALPLMTSTEASPT